MQYAAFEAGLTAPASEVYLHEMPGGQFTNLKAQARSMGLEERWREVAEMYAEVNRMFGDIVKVTPSSKVVGDMALMMVAQGLTRAQVEDPHTEVAFPGERRRHDARQPGAAAGRLAGGVAAESAEGGEAADRAAGGGDAAGGPGQAAERDLEAQAGEVSVDNEDFCGYLMYPKVFTEYLHGHQEYGPVRTLPTPVYFYGMQPGRGDAVEIDPGKTIEVRLQAVGETNDEGDVRVSSS